MEKGKKSPNATPAGQRGRPQAAEASAVAPGIAHVLKAEKGDMRS